MPKGNEKYSAYYNVEPKDYSVEFSQFLNKFEDPKGKVDDMELSDKEQKCWTALKEYQKENGGEENTQSVNMDNVQFKYIVNHPTYTSMIKNVAALGVENCGYPAFQFTAYDKNNMAWINSIKAEASTLGEILDKAQEELDKKEGKTKDEENPENQKEGEKETEGKEEGKEDKPRQNGIIGVIVKLGDKARESNDKAMGIFHDKGDATSRRAFKPEVGKADENELESDEITVEIEESENENQGVHIDMEVIEQEREAAGLVEPEPETLTNFRAQAAAEEEMSRSQDQAETMLEMGMDKNN